MRLLALNPSVTLSDCFIVTLIGDFVTTNTSLCMACCYSTLEMVDIILEDPDTSPTDPNNFPIYAACYHGKKDIVIRLLQTGKVDPSQNKNRAILNSMKYPDIFELLLNQESVYNSVNFNVLMSTAIAQNSKEIVTLLLKIPNFRFSSACIVNSTRNASILELLLNADNIENNVSSFNLAFHEAVQTGDLKCTTMLIKDCRVDPGSGDQMAIRVAWLDKDIFSLLLNDSRVDPAAANNSPLKRAVERDAIGIVEMLLQDSR
jgi:hypothetical protein